MPTATPSRRSASNVTSRPRAVRPRTATPSDCDVGEGEPRARARGFFVWVQRACLAGSPGAILQPELGSHANREVETHETSIHDRNDGRGRDAGRIDVGGARAGELPD